MTLAMHIGQTYPVDCLPVLLGAVRIRDLIILVVRSNDVQENGTALKDLELATALVLIGKGGNASIWVDLKEPRLLLLVLTEV